MLSIKGLSINKISPVRQKGFAGRDCRSIEGMILTSFPRLINPTYTGVETKTQFAALGKYKSWIALPGKVRLAGRLGRLRGTFPACPNSRIVAGKKKGDAVGRTKTR